MTRPNSSKRRLKRSPPAVAYISTRPCSSCMYTEIGVCVASESVVRKPAAYPKRVVNPVWEIWATTRPSSS